MKQDISTRSTVMASIVQNALMHTQARRRYTPQTNRSAMTQMAPEPHRQVKMESRATNGAYTSYCRRARTKMPHTTSETSETKQPSVKAIVRARSSAGQMARRMRRRMTSASKPAQQAGMSHTVQDRSLVYFATVDEKRNGSSSVGEVTAQAESPCEAPYAHCASHSPAPDESPVEGVYPLVDSSAHGFWPCSHLLFRYASLLAAHAGSPRHCAREATSIERSCRPTPQRVVTNAQPCR
mmetsp:Transcript_25352/g.62773  ORF Transcript_25352/g.62773 Transcript_25352/m.62773 type:complete len:239 (-) Transcript_25352:776-1492(-)